ncbi:cytochrome-c peroxidase [Ekhidna sp. To15]|uniref:cytochrome-c peroxidase n=1 Tax=Ekhidna sp. To15 TaxID=3395267 RepID=UPI003F51BA42
MTKKWLLLLSLIYFLNACSSAEVEETITISDQDAILEQFNGDIDLNELPNYANQAVPAYISKDNTSGNPITDRGAILGRILFYDKNLSSDNSIACASCHQQAFAFGDGDLASTGVNGTTGRHSMRLINARFAEEANFFWDERAGSLEEQTTQPIQDHIEMGFSGHNGDDDINSLFDRLESIEHYNELFTSVYGDEQVTEQRMQNALSQFIRSIQSFDSKYDEGRALSGNNNENFSNFTAEENEGKELFMRRPNFNNNGVRIGGGLGCNACHRAPEFDIDPGSRNNGIIASLSNPDELDIEVTRSPSLRDLFNNAGEANGPMMHTGFTEDIDEVLEHYNNISESGNGLDRRLNPNGNPQNLAMTESEKEAVVAFLMTLSGSDVYSNLKWGNPFSQ